jgi:hypothetical protein
LTQFPDDPPSRKVFDELAAAFSEIKAHQNSAEASAQDPADAAGKKFGKP